jgi:hypothetical protein
MTRCENYPVLLVSFYVLKLGSLFENKTALLDSAGLLLVCARNFSFFGPNNFLTNLRVLRCVLPWCR